MLLSNFPQGGNEDYVIEQNKSLQQKFWRGTKDEYDAMAEHSDDIMYIITDDEGGEGRDYYTKAEIDTKEAELKETKADKSKVSTITLAAASWSDNQQTVSNALFKASGFAYTVAPASTSYSAYADAGIYADDVTTDGAMVFHCSDVPSEAITVNILRNEVA